ncbi:NAD(P)/FAD-dependent oxidoreductase [bacterium]|nr:NAD(P)/FAD-dependent oxidoreductase [bacterium]
MTTTIQNAAGRRWDALVVGAGPAGALSACLLARAGRSVLLVDKKSFPRYKACGCCLNGSALGTLQSVGLGAVASRLGAVELDRLCIAAGTRRASLKLVRAVAISRAALDAELALEAVRSGAEFLDGTEALPIESKPDCWRVGLRSDGVAVEVEASVLIAADGLAGRTADPAGKPSIRPGAKMGLGAIVPVAPDFYRPGVIHMACGECGYAGLVRLEDGRLNIGAAVDPACTRDRGPAGAVAEILESCGLEPINFSELVWRGVPPLTRRRARVAGHRLFALGDSAGYVEPFTGEGMAWAVGGAAALAPIASRPWSPEAADEWERTFRRMIAQHWRACRALAWLLRHPALTRAAVLVLGVAPTLAAPLIRAIQTPEAAP